jgi:hypothetical protein
LKVILEQEIQSNRLALKLHSYLVYLAAKRILKVEFPKIKFYQIDSFEEKDLLSPVKLIVYRSQDGFIANTYQLIETRINFLSMINDLNRDKFLEKITNSLESFDLYLPNFIEESHKEPKCFRDDIIVTSREKEDKFLRILEHESLVGFLKKIDPLTLAQGSLISEDPFNLLLSPKPYPSMDMWNFDKNDDTSILKEKAIAILKANSGENNIVLAGELNLWIEKVRYTFQMGTYFFENQFKSQKITIPSGYNGRFIYSMEGNAYKPINPNLFFAIQIGGVLRLLDGSNCLLPSYDFMEISGWNYDPRNPINLVYENENVAWLEKYIGKNDILSSRDFRIPYLHRWVSSKKAIEDFLSNHPDFELRTILDFQQVEETF